MYHYKAKKLFIFHAWSKNRVTNNTNVKFTHSSSNHRFGVSFQNIFAPMMWTRHSLVVLTLSRSPNLMRAQATAFLRRPPDPLKFEHRSKRLACFPRLMSSGHSVANSVVFPRNWACFRPVPRDKTSSCELRFFWASFYAHAAIFGLVSKVMVSTPCVTIRAVIFYVS